jgi:hypothetical protein
MLAARQHVSSSPLISHNHGNPRLSPGVRSAQLGWPGIIAQNDADRNRKRRSGKVAERLLSPWSRVAFVLDIFTGERCGIPRMIEPEGITNQPVRRGHAIHLTDYPLAPMDVHHHHGREPREDHRGCRPSGRAFVPRELLTPSRQRGADLPLDEGVHQQP